MGIQTYSRFSDLVASVTAVVFIVGQIGPGSMLGIDANCLNARNSLVV